MFDFGFWELVLVMIVALLVVGPKRLPELAARAGQAMGRLRRLAQQFRDNLQQELHTEELRKVLHQQQDELDTLRTQIGDLKDAASAPPADAPRERTHD